MSVFEAMQEYVVLLRSKGVEAAKFLAEPAPTELVEAASRQIGRMPADLVELWQHNNGMRAVPYAPFRNLFVGYLPLGVNESMLMRADSSQADGMWSEQLAKSEQLRTYGPLLPSFGWDTLTLNLPLGSPPGSELILLYAFGVPGEDDILHTGLDVEGFIRLNAQLVEQGSVVVGEDGALRYEHHSSLPVPSVDPRLAGLATWQL